MKNMKDDDMLIITADHGNDPTTPSTDHSREYTPILVYGKQINPNTKFAIRKGYIAIFIQNSYIIIMEINVSVYFILFIIYAMIGWCIEIINGLIQTKKFVNRGFLIGPYCPIYGVGGILITLLLSKYYDDPIVLFFMGIAVCGILEYLTSYIMEKFFKARWWDYSKRKFRLP